MTSEDITPDPAAFLNDYAEKDRTFQVLAASLHAANKTALFDALQTADITRVVVVFDGCGDSGQVEDLAASKDDQPRKLPPGTVAIARAHWGMTEAQQDRLSVKEAIETLAYDLLYQTHAGWENNAGAFGEFIFDVVDRSITLDFNERYEDSTYTQHVF